MNGSKRFVVLLFLGALSMFTYMDRLCISVIAPRMQKELGLAPREWGWVFGIFLLSYGALEIPMGALGDRWGQRGVLARIVLWWSAFTALTGVVSNFWGLLGVRFLFGAGEAGAYPNASGSIGRWFPKTERAKAQGAVWGSSRLGGAFAPLAILALANRWGWRACFLCLGAVGLVWTVAWLAWYRNPPQAAIKIAGTPWKHLARSRQIWTIMAMYWFYVWGSSFYLSWFHTYLMTGRGFNERELVKYAAYPFLAGAAGNLIGGFLSDGLTRSYGAFLGRNVVGAVCLAISATCLFATAQTQGRFTAVVLLTTGFGVMDCMLPAAWALCLDIGKEHSGLVSGAMNSAGQFGGFVCSVLFGEIVQRAGNFNTPLLLIAGMVAVSALLFLRIDSAKSVLSTQTALT